jgi:hypothetical protein
VLVRDGVNKGVTSHEAEETRVREGSRLPKGGLNRRRDQAGRTRQTPRSGRKIAGAVTSSSGLPWGVCRPPESGHPKRAEGRPTT